MPEAMLWTSSGEAGNMLFWSLKFQCDPAFVSCPGADVGVIGSTPNVGSIACWKVRSKSWTLLAVSMSGNMGRCDLSSLTSCSSTSVYQFQLVVKNEAHWDVVPSRVSSSETYPARSPLFFCVTTYSQSISFLTQSPQRGFRLSHFALRWRQSRHLSRN